MNPMPVRGEIYENEDGIRIFVTRRAKDGSWADMVVTPSRGPGWRKRQPLRGGRFPFPVTLLPAEPTASPPAMSMPEALADYDRRVGEGDAQ